MSDKTAIEWTDTTWNPVRGCTKVSPGCANCYAETFAERWRGVPGHAYEQGFDLRLVPEKLDEPLRWKKPRRVFVNSMSDLFQDGVPDEFIDRVFAVMALAPQHTFQVLTKRAERMRDYCRKTSTIENVYAVACERVEAVADTWQWPLPNVWLGVSVENQHFADERIPLLLQTPAAVRFISAEPLLGPIRFGYGTLDGCDACCTGDRCEGPPECTRFNRRSCPVCKGTANGNNLDWVIVGGESGHGSRPFDIAWARSIVKQCKAAGVPAFVKQLGVVPVMDEAEWRADERMRLLNHVNHRRAPAGTVPLKFYSSKAGNPEEWPEDLRVREFPTSRS